MTFNTVIFDFGGVITSSPFEAFNRMEAERGLPKDFVRRVNSVNPDNNAWAKFERAECSANEFDALFAAEAQALGHALDGVSVIACLAGEIRPDMVAALDQLKSLGFTLGCITNNVPSGKGAGMACSMKLAYERDARRFTAGSSCSTAKAKGLTSSAASAGMQRIDSASASRVLLPSFQLQTSRSNK